MFGVLAGTIIVSFASTIGATIAFLSSRYLFRDTIKARFGDRLKAIDDGVEKDGPFYLLTLRLVPIFPFFLINLLMGLTAIKARTFYIVSQIGMLLGTVVYVNAGTQLANIDEVSDIGSPGLLLSFAALGITPWIGKWIVGLIKRRKVYARWTRPKNMTAIWW
nr:VTT domain-containing protein [Sphingopyxis sp. BSNA05]